MRDIKDFILSNWFSLVIALVVGLYTISLVVTQQWEKLRINAENLMEWAENNILGTKKGQERMAYVLDQIYQLLPAWLRIFISREKLQEILQNWYNSIKDYLDNGKIDGSI